MILGKVIANSIGAKGDFAHDDAIHSTAGSDRNNPVDTMDGIRCTLPQQMFLLRKSYILRAENLGIVINGELLATHVWGLMAMTQFTVVRFVL